MKFSKFGCRICFKLQERPQKLAQLSEAAQEPPSNQTRCLATSQQPDSLLSNQFRCLATRFVAQQLVSLPSNLITTRFVAQQPHSNLIRCLATRFVAQQPHTNQIRCLATFYQSDSLLSNVLSTRFVAWQPHSNQIRCLATAQQPDSLLSKSIRQLNIITKPTHFSIIFFLTLLLLNLNRFLFLTNFLFATKNLTSRRKVKRTTLQNCVIFQNTIPIQYFSCSVIKMGGKIIFFPPTGRQKNFMMRKRKIFEKNLLKCRRVKAKKKKNTPLKCYTLNCCLLEILQKPS